MLGAGVAPVGAGVAPAAGVGDVFLEGSSAAEGEQSSWLYSKCAMIPVSPPVAAVVDFRQF